MPVKHITQTIFCPPEKVYQFVSDPVNLPQWASGLSQGDLYQEDGIWVAESPMGKIKIKFASKNHFGIADHDVTVPSGQVFYNPMRVIPNGDASEVVFTLFRQPEMTDEKFEEDRRWIEKDLLQLKAILEK